MLTQKSKEIEKITEKRPKKSPQPRMPSTSKASRMGKKTKKRTHSRNKKERQKWKRQAMPTSYGYKKMAQQRPMFYKGED